jgi:hypothetical protein
MSERLRVWNTPSARPELRLLPLPLALLTETCFAGALQLRQFVVSPAAATVAKAHSTAPQSTEMTRELFIAISPSLKEYRTIDHAARPIPCDCVKRR